MSGLDGLGWPTEHEVVRVEKVGMGTKPDPTNFKIIETQAGKNATLVTAKYPGCTQFGGVKLILFNRSFHKFDTLDPHFFEDYPLVARFAPTPEGRLLAQTAFDLLEGKLMTAFDIERRRVEVGLPQDGDDVIIECALCNYPVWYRDSWSPGDDALCSECDTEVTGRKHPPRLDPRVDAPPFDQYPELYKKDENQSVQDRAASTADAAGDVRPDAKG